MLEEHSDLPKTTYELEDLEEFFENAALSLHWVGPDGTILRANKYELDFLGYERSEYEGRSIKDFHVDGDVIDDILERLTRGETLTDYPARLRAKDGSIRHVVINSNVRWVDGEFVHTRCFTRDVTDRVLAEEALAQAKHDLERQVDERTADLRRANAELEDLVEMRNRFVAIVSHELRTPLTSISGFTTTIQRYWDSLADDRKREFLGIIEHQSHRLSRLVNDLLTLSRVTSNKLEVHEQTVALRDVVATALAELQVDADVDIARDLAACADADHLHQIVVNYLTNASKYGDPPLRVVGRRAGDCVELVVCDEGPGVPADFVAQLFQEFSHRPPHDAADPQPGTGLGLAIVRHLAEAQGGSAWYEANQPRGSRFGVRLPLARAA